MSEGVTTLSALVGVLYFGRLLLLSRKRSYFVLPPMPGTLPMASNVPLAPSQLELVVVHGW